MPEQMNLDQTVDEALKTLTDRERQVLELRYGYNGKALTQIAIGEAYDVTKTRIQQIEESAIRKLRHPYRIKKLQPFLYQAVSQGKDNFYARLFTKLFKLNQDLIHNIIEAGPPIVETGISQEPPPKEVSLSSSIECLELSIHSFNCLMRAGVHTVQDLMNLSDEKLCKIRNLGAKSIAEIREKRSKLNAELHLSYTGVQNEKVL